jgi:integrase
MPKILTDAAVRKYRGGKTRREIRDGGAQGLFLIVQPSGAKSWALRYRRPDGRPSKLTLGPVDFSGKEPGGEPVFGTPLSLASARALAAEQHRQRKRGIDVAARHLSEKRQKAQASQLAAANTFATLARVHIDEHARPHTRRWRDTARLLGFAYPNDGGEPIMIKRGLADRWRNRGVASVDGGDLYGVIDETRRIGVPGLARRRKGASDTRARAMGAALSKLFSWLVEHRKIALNPAVGMYKPKAPQARDRVLSEAEIAWFWLGCDTLGEPFASLLKLLLLTGCRRGEVAGMMYGELSEDGTIWTIPGARTKNGRQHVIYLPPLARDIIDAVSRVEGKAGYLFTTTGKSPVSGWSKIKRRLDAAMLAVARAERGPDAAVREWRLHDLRRTCATEMAELGIPPHIIEVVLNHISGHKAGVAGVYNRAEHTAERKAALEIWATHVEALVAGPSAKVLAFKSVQ